MMIRVLRSLENLGNLESLYHNSQGITFEVRGNLENLENLYHNGQGITFEVRGNLENLENLYHSGQGITFEVRENLENLGTSGIFLVQGILSPSPWFCSFTVGTYAKSILWSIKICCPGKM